LSVWQEALSAKQSSDSDFDARYANGDLLDVLEFEACLQGKKPGRVRGLAGGKVCAMIWGRRRKIRADGL